MHDSPALATHRVPLPRRVALPRVPVWLPAVMLLALLVAVGQAGYHGAGGDDWHYLEAARCAAEHGLCLPQTHWAARFPLILPMAAAIATFGIGDWSVGLVPLLYSCTAVALVALNVERRFGRAVAVLASAAFVLTPAICLNAAQPLVDMPELAWTLAALLAVQVAVERSDGRAAAIAGVALAIAVMSRMSALSFLPIAALGWLMLPANLRRIVLPFGLAFVATLGLEAGGYWLATGDPAYGWLLSLHHTQIATTELPAGVDVSKSALFNMDLVAAWRRSMGIHVHWTIDPILNLLADPLCGLTLLGAAALALIGRSGWRDSRWVAPLAAAAMLHFLILTYVLAVDPKPRMFAFDYAVAASVIGVFGVRAWHNGKRAIVVAIIVLMAVRAVTMAADRIDTSDAKRTAAAWIAAAPGDLAIDDWTRRSMALVPAAYALPVATSATRAPIVILTAESCAEAAAVRGGDWRVRRTARFQPQDLAIIAAMRARSILFAPREVATLCLISPAPDRAGSPPR